MGYVDRTIKVSLDAFLTQRGRQLLLTGNSKTKISYFGLGDGDINYDLITVNNDIDFTQTYVPDISGDVGDCLKSLVDGVTQPNLLQYKNTTTDIIKNDNYIRLVYDNDEIGSDNIPYVVNNFDIDLREYVNYLRTAANGDAENSFDTGTYWLGKNAIISASAGKLTNNNFSTYLKNFIKLSKPYTDPTKEKSLLLFKDTVITSKTYRNGEYESMNLLSVSGLSFTYTPLNANLFKRMFWNASPTTPTVSGTAKTSNIVFGVGQVGLNSNAGYIKLYTDNNQPAGTCTGTTTPAILAAAGAIGSAAATAAINAYIAAHGPSNTAAISAAGSSAASVATAAYIATQTNPRKNKYYQAAIDLINFIQTSPDFETVIISGNTRYINKERIYIEINVPGYTIKPKPVIGLNFYFDNITSGELTRALYYAGDAKGVKNPELNQVILKSKYILPEPCHNGLTT